MKQLIVDLIKQFLKSKSIKRLEKLIESKQRELLNSKHSIDNETLTIGINTVKIEELETELNKIKGYEKPEKFQEVIPVQSPAQEVPEEPAPAVVEEESVKVESVPT